MNRHAVFALIANRQLLQPLISHHCSDFGVLYYLGKLDLSQPFDLFIPNQLLLNDGGKST
jgi:hypothetical protein